MIRVNFVEGSIVVDVINADEDFAFLGGRPGEFCLEFMLADEIGLSAALGLC